MDFKEIEKAYAMGRAYAQGLKHAKLMAKLNSVAQDDTVAEKKDKKSNKAVNHEQN
jgi:hypothetical protein